MEPSERSDVLRRLAGLAVLFGEEFTDERAAVYLAAIEDMPAGVLKAAIRQAAKARRFFPRPAELRELAGESGPDAGLVEALLVDHLRQPGGERRLPADPYLVTVIERLGGLYQTAGMDSGHRVTLLTKLLPGINAACLARGVPFPANVPSADALRLVARAGQPPLEAPPSTRPSLPAPVRALVEGIGREA